jgi:aquaporin NIP
VTLAFVIAQRFPFRLLLPYILAQFTGAFIAGITIRLLFPVRSTLGRTLPSGYDSQSFFLEIILSMILMFVILRVSSGAKE